jgi:hypothetical protein
MAAIQRVIDSDDDIYEALGTMRRFWDSDESVLVGALKACTGKQQCRALACMVMFVRQTSCITAHAIDIVPVLVAFLAASSPAQSQCEALQLLTDLCRSASDSACTGIIAPEIPKVVKLLEGPNCSVICSALKAIACLTRKRVTCLRTFGIAHPRIFALLTVDQNTEIISNALDVIACFLYQNMEDVAINNTCISICAKLSYHNDLHVQDTAISVLAHLAPVKCGKKELHPALAALAPRIARLMLHPHAALTKATTKWAVNMSARGSEHRKVVVDAGIVPICGRLLVENSEIFSESEGVIETSKVARRAATTIANVLRGTPDHIQVVIDAGIIPLLMQQAHSPAERMVESVKEALVNLCNHGTLNQVWYLLGEGFLQLCAELLAAETVAQRKFVRAAQACIEIYLQCDAEFAEAGLSSPGDVAEYCELLEIPRLMMNTAPWFPYTEAQVILSNCLPEHSGLGPTLVTKALTGFNVVEDIMEANESNGTTTEDVDEAVEYMHSSGWSRRRHALYVWADEWTPSWTASHSSQ